MAQLSDDCFAFGGPLKPLDETAALIASQLSAVEESETVPLTLAAGIAWRFDPTRASRGAALFARIGRAF